MQKFFEDYSMPLKYLIISAKWDLNVLNDPNRGDSRDDKTMGILWDMVEDTVLALPKYILHGTSRASPWGQT